MGTNAICWLAYNHDPEVSDPAYGPPTGGKIVPFNSHCRHFPTNDPIPYKPRRYVALKIINTIQFNDNGPDSEFVCHRHLNENAPGVAPMVYESFEIKDAVRNMKHRCIAMEIVGPTIFTMMKNINPHMPHLPIELSRRYGARFLEAVEKMHRVGVVHGGE